MNESTDVANLESAVLQAIVDRRWDSLGALLDEDFVITTAGWLNVPAGKDQWIREVEAIHQLHEFSVESIVERPFEDVCIALVLSRQIATWRGTRQEFRFRYTDVWRRHSAGWLLCVRHASLVTASH